IEVEGKDIVEAALRQTPVQRHLTTLKALDADAGARGLALAAAPAGLALAGPDAAADAHAALAGARVVGNLVELHGAVPWEAQASRPHPFLKPKSGRDARAPAISLQPPPRDGRLWRSCPAPTAYPAIR